MSKNVRIRIGWRYQGEVSYVNEGTIRSIEIPSIALNDVWIFGMVLCIFRFAKRDENLILAGVYGPLVASSPGAILHFF